jgi:uncharacterized damage-inducible protein DinB
MASTTATEDASLRKLLYHVHFTQRAFFQVWTDGQVPPYDVDSFESVVQLHAWARSYYPEVTGFLTTLNAGRLDETVSPPWARMFEKKLGKSIHATTLGETVFQVWAHTHYHRGQVNAQLRQLGGEPPLVDYIAWIWADRPAPVWPQPNPAG